MEQQLNKLRGHFNGTQASIAKLLEAIEQTIQPNLQPIHYYQALRSIINSTQQESIVQDSIYLLAIIIPQLSNQIIQQETFNILSLINQTSTTRSKLTILQPIYRFTQPSTTTLQTLSQTILPLLISQQPKVRRITQNFINQIISSDYQQPIIQFTLKHLRLPSTNPSITISLLKFIQSIIHHFQPEQLIQELNQLKPTNDQQQPFLSTTLFETYQSLLDQTHPPSTQIIISIIHQLIDHPNSIHNPAQLNALELAWINLAKLNQESCTNELDRIGGLKNLFNNFTHPDQQTRSATESLLSSISKYCITDHQIQQSINNNNNNNNSSQSSLQLILDSILKGLLSTDLIAVGGTVELINLLESLIIRLTKNHQPSIQLIQPHILQLDKLRSTRLGLTSNIDHCLSSISLKYGPKFLLDILPLNLNLDDNHNNQTIGRAWLLTIIKVFNSDLAHFISYFVPLSENLFERKRNTLKLANTTSVDQKLKQNYLLQIKIYDTLIDQIWRLLPAYCDLPRDLELAFDRSFAELLTQVIYSQPSLRPPILNSLKLLIDKVLVLTKRNEIINNEFGFDPHSHLNHLKTFAPNFLSVLFNVYNSSYDSSEHPSSSNNSNRGYMVDCMRSLLEILSNKELNDSYQKIKSLLDQSIKSKSQATVTTQKMLDLLTVLLPRLITSTTTTTEKEGRADRIKRLKEVQGLISQDQFILSSDPNLQKKSFKLIATFLELVCQHGLVNEAIEDLDGLIKKLLGIDGKGKVSGSAKRDRALLVSSLVSVIPADKLHYIPRLLTEVVLGCKEANHDVRSQSYEVLIKIGNKMKEHGGKVNWKALVDGLEDEEDEENEIMDHSDQEASIEEFFKMISAGLAGTSPHMVSATIAALSRALFEFHNDLSRTTIDELISTIEIFLNSPNREIAKTAIGFMKVAVVSLGKEVIKEQLEKIVPGLLKWAAEHKNYFKTNIQNLLERLLRLFGFETLEKFVSSRDENDGGRKLVNSLVKKQKKKKLARQARSENPADEDRNGVDDHESDQDRPVRQPPLGDAYEEALYGSESSDDDKDDEGKEAHQVGARHKGGNSKLMDKSNNKKKKNRDGVTLDNQLLEDDEDQIMDLLDGGRMANRVFTGKVAKAEKRKEELQRIGAGYKKDSETGKMIIESDDEGSHQRKQAKEIEGGDESTNAFLEAVHGADGFRRDARGIAKPNKKRKPTLELGDQDLDDQVEAVQDLRITDHDSGVSLQNKKKKVKRVKEKLGSEFKAKKAGGDRVSRDKNGQEISPFAYLPLSSLNSKKKKNSVAKSLDITGKVRGSASRS